MEPDLAALTGHFPPSAGPVGLLSGDEFTSAVAAFDRALLDLTGPAVGLIVCADHRAAPNSVARAREHLGALGARVVAEDLIHADELAGVDLVYIAGGSPAELLAHLHGSPGWRYIDDLWRRGVGIAGSSAGAMVLCSHSLVPRSGDKVPKIWSDGLGIVEGIGLAVHASSRPRDWVEQVAAAATWPVLALDDQTGILLQAGDEPQVIGPGSVWFVREQ